MSCEHEIKLIVAPTDDACRFHVDVRAYKDRIVAPDEYPGATEVTPSDSEQVLPTKDKLVRDDIVVNPAPTEVLSTDHNGTFTPSEGKVGFYQVDVDVNPDLRPLSVSENGSYVPDGFDGYSRVSVDTGIKCVTGKFRVEQELVWTNALEKSVPHNLGAVPSMIVIWTHNNDVENKGGRTIVSIWVDRDELALPWIEETSIPYVANFFLPWGSDLQMLNVAKSTHKTAGLKYKPTATEFHLISDSVYKNYFPGIYYYLLVAGGWESYANNHISDDDVYVVN